MKTIEYVGPVPAKTAMLVLGKVVSIGDTVEVTDQVAERLLALPTWRLADEAPTGPPAPSAAKAVWVAYAETLGVATDGLTKDQVIAAIEANAEQLESTDPVADDNAQEG